MAVIKYHAIERDLQGNIIDEQWIPIYAGAIENRLRRDNNLSDLHDPSAARKNLGIVGDVTDIPNSHNHDDHYNEWRQADREENERARAALYAELTKNITNNYSGVDEKINSFIESFTSINAATNENLNLEIKARTEADAKLQGQINTNKQNIEKYKDSMNSAKDDISSQISNLTNNYNTLSSKLDKEIDDSTKAHRDINTRINGIVNDFNTATSDISGDLSKEKTERVNADNELSRDITVVSNDLKSEISNRKAAEKEINNKVSANTNNISTISSTVGTHTKSINSITAKDTKQDERLNALETKCKKISDDLTFETSNRVAKDEELKLAIKQLEGALRAEMKYVRIPTKDDGVSNIWIA